MFTRKQRLEHSAEAARTAGEKGQAAQPTGAYARTQWYVAQNGTAKLTPKRSRRRAHKARSHQANNAPLKGHTTREAARELTNI